MSNEGNAVKAKTRLLHPRLAALVATLRHGEMIYVSDAGSGSGPKAVVPLDPGVEVIDLGVATGVPSFRDVVGAICEVGDIEGVIVSSGMATVNPATFSYLEGVFRPEAIHPIPYFPNFYMVRDRVKAMVQTGDYGVGANCLLIGGYSSAPIPLDWLTSSAWFEELKRTGGRLVTDGRTWAPAPPATAASDTAPEPAKDA